MVSKKVFAKNIWAWNNKKKQTLKNNQAVSFCVVVDNDNQLFADIKSLFQWMVTGHYGMSGPTVH